MRITAELRALQLSLYGIENMVRDAPYIREQDLVSPSGHSLPVVVVLH